MIAIQRDIAETTMGRIPNQNFSRVLAHLDTDSKTGSKSYNLGGLADSELMAAARIRNAVSEACEKNDNDTEESATPQPTPEESEVGIDKGSQSSQEEEVRA